MSRNPFALMKELHRGTGFAHVQHLMDQVIGNAVTLTLTNLVDSESGSYFVVLSNAAGVVTSALATLQVSSEPDIISQTGGGALQMFVGQSYTFSVTVAGAAPLSYQWFTNGVADTTAGSSSSYALTSVPLTAAGTYQCVVVNAFGRATNVLTTLTVVNLPPT